MLGWETIMMLLGVGIVAGVAAGFIGIGGGVIMVPVLIEIFTAWEIHPDVLVQSAMATSLAVGIFAGISSAVRHGIQRNVLWRQVAALAPGAVVGGWVAGHTARYIPGEWLMLGLAFVLLLAALKWLLERRVQEKPMRDLPFWGWLLMGLATGVFAGYTGLGGGILLVPLMAYIAHVPTKNLAGTSSGVVIFAALSATVRNLTLQPLVDPGAAFLGHVHWVVALSLIATVVPGAQLGAWLNRKAGSVLYKRIFGALLIYEVIRLVWKSLS